MEAEPSRMSAEGPAKGSAATPLVFTCSRQPVFGSLSTPGYAPTPALAVKWYVWPSDRLQRQGTMLPAP